MIIQKVIKGINNISRDEAKHTLQVGIICRWWQEVNQLPQNEVPQRLTERNLFWHQNFYQEFDPNENNQPFYLILLCQLSVYLSKSYCLRECRCSIISRTSSFDTTF
jgi:hypothetical protein